MILYVPFAIPKTAIAAQVDYGIPQASDAANSSALAGGRYRQRDYGIGYGSSSGYASGRAYTDRSTASYFRCG